MSENRIILKKKIGEGGQGKVFLATYVVDPTHHPRKTISSAVKQIKANQMDMEEVMLQASLSKHPKCNKLIACYYDLFQNPKTRDYYIVMEYIEGKELWDYVRSAAKSEHPLTSAQILILARQALKGLKFIHSRGIAHGDIKMENLMIDKRGDLKYIDFGYGCSEATCRTSKVWHGTTFLAPPEATMDPTRRKTLKSLQEADLWALGCMLAEIILTNANGEIVRVDNVQLDGKSAATARHWKPSKQFPLNRTLLPLYTVIDGLMAINPGKRITASSALKTLSGK